jgi:hypothetical protein
MSLRQEEGSPIARTLRQGLVLAAVLAIAPAFWSPAASAAPAPSGQAQASAGTKAAKPKATGTKATGTKAASTKAASTKAASTKAASTKAASTKAAKPKQAAAGKQGRNAVAKKKEDLKPGPLADFGQVSAPGEVVHVANWVSYSRNNKKKAFVLIDKKNAQLYVFDPQGKLKSHAPVLLGKAVGDHSAPGIGNKPLSQIKEEEKTTPAGRFLALPGKNNHGEDIIWIDYNAAVSMHRLRKVAEEERRAERMATPDSDDNRISNGCVNVPPQFYNAVLNPTVRKYGAYVYVLPETRSAQQLFGSFDVPNKPVQVAGADASGGPAAGRRAAPSS